MSDPTRAPEPTVSLALAVALMARAQAAATGSPAPAKPAAAPTDVRALADAARVLRCLSLVAGPLGADRDCPPDLADELARVRSGTWATYAVTQAAIAPALAEAHAEGLDLIVYKGGAYAARYYAEPSARPMTDIDLLVSQKDREALSRLLLARGFRGMSTPARRWTGRVAHESTFAPTLPGARTVDIHTAPAPPARYRLPVAEMRARARPGVLWDAPVRFLAPEDELLVMAANQAYDHFRFGFVRFLDAWLLCRAERLDWQSLVARAHAAGVATALYTTLSNAVRVAGLSVPADMLRALEPTPVRRAWLRSMLHTEALGDPRFDLPRRLEQLLLVYPFVDRPLDFARFALYHGALRALDAGQDLVDRARGRSSSARAS